MTKLPESISELPETINSFWQFHWKKTLLVVLLLLFFFGLSWIIQYRRWKRILTSSTSLLLVCFIVSLPLMYAVAAKGLVVFLPTDSGVTTDAIVVLGRGLENGNRVDVAAELWRTRRATRIFVSAGGEGNMLRKQLQARGIPNQALDGENCSQTTEENALFTAAILHPQGIQQILLITDPPHMLRALLTFRANGFKVTPYTSQLPEHLSFKAKIYLNLREFIGLVSYGLKGLFFPQRSPELDNPDIADLLQQAKQYSQQRRL